MIHEFQLMEGPVVAANW